MSYREELRRRICRWTGLSGVEVDAILRALEKSGVDPEVVDWETLGHDIADKVNPYWAAWEWLRREYGVSKPIEVGLNETVRRMEMEEEERLIESDEGVKELLRRIYEYKDVSGRKKKRYKELLKEAVPGIVTLIALYNGVEREYAKRFLEEEVIGRKEEEEIVVTEELVDKMMEKEMRGEELTEEDIQKLLEEKEKLVAQRNEELRRWIVTQLEGYDPYVRIGVDIDGNDVVIKGWYEGTGALKRLHSRTFPVKEILTPFFAKGSVDDVEELKKNILSEMKKRHHILISMGISAAGYFVERVKRKGVYMCDVCGYVCSEKRASEVGYICPRCGIPLTLAVT